MGRGAKKNYNFKQKNDWRGWSWNTAVKRLDKKTKDATVLYLAGNENIDYDMGIKRGFQKQNLIAIDIDEKNITNARKNGTIGISGTLNDVLSSWDYSPSVDIIFADYCSGLEKHISNFILSLYCSKGTHRDTIVCANFQRGRESNWKLKKYISQIDECDNLEKHRGKIFMVFLDIFFFKSCPKRFLPNGEIRVLMPKFYPEFYSYKSDSGVYFDSVIFKLAIQLSNEFKNDYHNYFHELGLANLKNKITALKAVRTMKS